MLDEATDIKTILVVTAHPDDVDFGAAGSVAAWTDKGIDVRYCIVTDGDAGGFDPAVPRSEIPRIRREEQTNAAKTVGVTELYFLGYPDGRLQPTIELRRDISRVIRQVRPDRMLCPSPERNLTRLYASHPDHLAAGEASICAVYPDARNPWAHPELLQKEGLEAYTVPELWIMASNDADYFVDTTAQIERKIAALLCHESQMTDPDHIPKLVTDWGAAVASRAGLPVDRYAEGFHRIDTA
ncbi:MAG TPA: PIG-L deacetylase family protein [Acidimicrobiia bacterium]|nr:PIG-L deacetylase family protein [Acidimicrobiia bacterium]